jgi:hypothetical protein
VIDYTVDTTHSILIVRPKGALEEGDFNQLAKVVDPFIEKTGGLAGIIIDAPAFPGWRTLGALVDHFRFVRDHHRHIKKVALVTDSPLGNVAERLASHFVSAEVRHFPAGELGVAERWVMEHR